MDLVLPTVLTVVLMSGLTGKIRGRNVFFRGIMALTWWLNVAGDLTVWHFPALVSFSVPMAVYWTWRWLNSWKDKRRRARALIGAKSRALRDRLVRRLAGERARRPVLVPS